MEQMQIAVGWLLRIGIVVTLLFVGIGGISYLYQHASDTINYHVFHGATEEVTSVRAILVAAPTFAPRALMELGVLVLILTQILRIAIVAGYFIKMRDYKFTVISTFVLLMVIGAVFWHF